MHERLAALKPVLDRASLLGRMTLRRGLAFRARGVAEIVKSQLAGATGPSTIYRLNAAMKPDAPAIVYEGATTTWAELDSRIDRLAWGLRNQYGLGRGDRAVLVMRNRPEALETSVALSRLGAGAVTVSWRSTPAELEYLVTHSGAKAVFVDADVSDNVLRARPQLTTVKPDCFFAIGRTLEGFTPYPRAFASTSRPLDSEEGSLVIYTSGTTGKPKGAVRTFPKTAMDAVLQVILDTPIRGDDRHLVVCPMYHSTAFGFISFTFIVGGTAVIARDFDPEGFLASIERERITTTAVVPTMLHRVLQLPPETIAKYDTRSLRAVFCGGAALSGTLARRFIETFGHVLYNFYGATETGVNTLATSDELLRAPGTIGHVVPGNEIRILDDEGRELPRGETGELWVRNAMLVAGYHRDEDATKKSMREGFFSVGDLAHVDQSGLLHIDGRKRDMIISGGVNVYPAEVEETLHRHPDVAEAAVVGVPDEEWGERVRAFVVPRVAALAEGDVIGWCKQHLAGPKVPREVVFLEELPKNPTGKVLKRELRNVAPS